MNFYTSILLFALSANSVAESMYLLLVHYAIQIQIVIA